MSLSGAMSPISSVANAIATAGWSFSAITTLPAQANGKAVYRRVWEDCHT